MRDIKKLAKVLLRMKRHGFDIEEIEVGVDDERIARDQKSN